MNYIYKITNLVNKKVYIGKTTKGQSRWTHHKCDLKNNMHHNPKLQSDWNKYGEQNFSFEIIEKCPKSELDQKEQYWINKYNSTETGYNISLGGNGCKGYKHNKHTLDKMRVVQKPNAILQFDTNFCLIGKWVGGVSQITKTLKYTKECILLRCNHKLTTPYKDCYWVFEEEFYDINFSWNKYINGETCFVIEKHTPKKKSNTRICQYSKDFELIKIWESYKELEHAGYTKNVICSICNKSRNKKSHKGFYWCYEGDELDKDYLITTNKAIINRMVKINQYSLDGTLLNTYSSIQEAENKSGCSRSSIYSVLNNKVESSKGYIWKRAI